jgi:predicted dehydrogenase
VELKELKFGVLGCGFWSKYQISAWRELGGVELVAIYNRTRSKADDFAKEFGVPKIYDTPEELIADPDIDFVDVITDAVVHAEHVNLCAKHKKPVICQKPMALSLEEGKGMVQACKDAGIPFMVHENWRWQAPVRKVKEIMDSGAIGKPFRCNIYWNTGYPVFDNQPYLAQIEHLIIADLGIHILDTARFFFGEAQSICCFTSTVNRKIKGEDSATIMMRMSDVNCIVQISFSSILEKEKFPETFALIEGEKGSIELCPDYWVRVTTKNETRSFRVPPPKYSWANPDYLVVQSSIVPTNANWLESLRAGKEPETSGADNLKTLQLVYLAYESAKTGNAINVGSL